jgi:hypothetical protein
VEDLGVDGRYINTSQDNELEIYTVGCTSVNLQGRTRWNMVIIFGFYKTWENCGLVER